mgnify:CR=1 FL=1
MPRIDALGRLRAGDVVAHNSGAIAIVTECNPDHCELAWLRATDRPARLSADELDAHTLALPGSFRHRVAIENEALEQDLRRRPKAVAEQLLDTLDRPATGADLRRMLVSAAVCSPKEADTWWNALVRQLEQGSQAPLGWDGHALSLTASEETGTTLATRFSRALPEARYTLWSGLGPTERDALMTEVIASGDSAAAATVVRLAASVSPVQATALRERVAQGDARLGAAAVLWGETVGVETILAQGAGHRKHRPLIRRVFDHVPVPLQERLAVRLLADTVTDDEPAALFLVDLLPSGTVPVLRRLDSLVPDDTRRSALSDWLEERMAESTMERPMRLSDPLLVRLAPIPVERVFTVSLAVARALARRHAEGQSGGLEGARWRSPDEVRLGAPEASSPAEDVRAAMRRVAELTLSNLPRDTRLSDGDLLALLPGLVRDLPPSWSALLARCLSSDPNRRPPNGTALWALLAQAAANEEVRKSAPIRLRMSIDVGLDTHIGAMKSRSNQTNQDACWWQSEGHIAFLALADGISVATAGSGDQAAALLMHSCARSWEAWCDRLQDPHATELEAREFLDATLDAANRTICTAARRAADGDLERHIPMGTTAVLALVMGDRLHLASMGDSRAWLSTALGTAQLTGDQNLRLEWLRSWQTQEPDDLSGEGGVLTGYLGHFDRDGLPELLPVAHRALSLLPGETIVLGTDGFSDYAAQGPADLAPLLDAAAASGDLTEAARGLVNAANRGGGGDNVTVMLARHRRS